MPNKKNKRKVRYLMLEARTRNKKREYYFVVIEYNPTMRYKRPVYFDYPEFRKTFSSKPVARKYAFETVDKLEARYKNLRFVCYDLHS